MESFNPEKLFISKILITGDFSEAVGVPPYMFMDEKYAGALAYIRQYYTDHGAVPTERRFKMDNGSVLLASKVDEPWSDLKDLLWQQWQRSVLDVGLNAAVREYKTGSVKEAVRILSLAVSDIHAEMPNSRDVDVTENGDDRLERYRERKNNPDTLVGIPTGFPTIDKATQGLQPGQLVVYTGLAKASKSTCAMKTAMTIQEKGYKVLYLTYEQTVEEQERRLDAYRAGFNDNLLNSGKFSPEQEQSLVDGIEMTSNLPAMLISQDCMTVSEIASKADMFEPDVIIVDGVYMMDDDRGETRGSPAALANIVAGLKFMAMRRNICVIAVTQSTPARTKGETLNSDSIMGSRAFAQYCNVAIGIERFPNTDQYRHESKKMRKIKILLSRSCPNVEIAADWLYDTAVFRENPDYLLDDGDYDDEDEYDDTEETTAY